MKIKGRFERTYGFHFQGKIISRTRYQRESRWQEQMKMKAIFSSETSINFQRTTRRYITEDSSLRNHSYTTVSDQQQQQRSRHEDESAPLRSMTSSLVSVTRSSRSRLWWCRGNELARSVNNLTASGHTCCFSHVTDPALRLYLFFPNVTC
jgi:hypothetical protein